MNRNLVKGVGLVAAFALAFGCGGSTGGGDGNDGGGPVLGGGSGTGSIAIRLVDDDLDVANTTGFFVTLRDANGSVASAGTRITCDSEDGVAIIEPSSGAETTDSGGEISGRIGCEAPGSYRFVCRLPGLGARSAAVTVRCGGQAPNGFSGFPGAGGGNLGGGDGDGVTDFDPTKLRITAVNFRDAGAEVSGTIDTNQVPDCDDQTAGFQPEPFTDAFVEFTITNNSAQTVNMSSFTYTVPDFPTTADFGSGRVAFTGANGLTIASGASGKVSGFFARANSGEKNFIGSSTGIGQLGFRNITFKVSGVTDQGEEFDVEAVAGATLQGYNNCS